jgi:hypothetical protein
MGTLRRNDRRAVSVVVMLLCRRRSDADLRRSGAGSLALLLDRPQPIGSLHPDSLPPVAVCERMLLGNSRVTLVGLIIAIFGVAFMFGGHPVIAVMLLLLAWVLVVLDEDMRSG